MKPYATKEEVAYEAVRAILNHLGSNLPTNATFSLALNQQRHVDAIYSDNHFGAPVGMSDSGCRLTISIDCSWPSRVLPGPVEKEAQS